MNGIFRLDNKIAVVTGAMGKLGSIWVRTLLENGATVIAIDLPGVRSLEFTSTQSQIVNYYVDITNRDSVFELASKCVNEIGIPDIIINNAGIDQPPALLQRSYRLEDVPTEVCRKIYDVNVIGAFHIMQAFGKYMLTKRQGSIINIGSLYAGVSPDAHFYDHIQCDPPFLKPPGYGASKAALNNLTKYFAAHWGPYGIRVNTLSPGGVLGGQDEEFKRKFCERVPLRRMAKYRDLIGPLLFLASDASSYVTGIELKIDGGFTVW